MFSVSKYVTLLVDASKVKTIICIFYITGKTYRQFTTLICNIFSYLAMAFTSNLQTLLKLSFGSV